MYLQDYRVQECRLPSPPSFKCNVLRESLSVDSQNIPCATLKRRRSWVISVYLWSELITFYPLTIWVSTDSCFCMTQIPEILVWKGLCNEMDIFFKDDKIQSVLFVCALPVFKNLNSLLLWYSYFYFFLASLKLPTNSKNPSSNPLQMLWSGDYDHENAHRNQPVVLKYHTGNRLELVNLRRSFLHPVKGGQWRKSTNGGEGSWYRNLDATSRKILRSKQALYIYFSLWPGILEILYTPAAHGHKYWFELIGPKQKYSSGDPAFAF